jgi:formyltetrahydrofolate-dependent phosphoribosylglycinamide formyltransferase
MTPTTPTPAANNPIRLAVLLSGSGRTLQNLADHIDSHRLNATIRLVLSSNPQAYGLTRARNMSLPTATVKRSDFQDPTRFADHTFNLIREAHADLVCLAGYLLKLPIPPDYIGRVINIHPALLPSFGGQGMYGHHVHQAVLDAGCKVSGCTVHFCDQNYDTGQIIVQRTCPVLENDSPDSLAQRVFEQESLAYPHAINLIAAQRVSILGPRTLISPEIP